MFEEVFKLFDNAKKLSVSDAWLYSFDEDIQEHFELLNLEDQLYLQGIDSKGESLGQYSPFTEALKRSEGERYQNITLKDTGAFYESYRIHVSRDSVTIFVDDTSLYDVPLTQTYGIDILGLTQENWDEINLMLAEKIIEYVERTLFQ